MGSVWTKSTQDIQMALPKVKEIVSSHTVVVFRFKCGDSRLSAKQVVALGLVGSHCDLIFSKTYCGFCKRVKQLFSELNVSYKLVELDEESDGNEVQSALAEWTGQRTVPNVFIGGKHIGGSDAVMEKHQAGKLVPMLTEAGAIANNSAQL